MSYREMSKEDQEVYKEIEKKYDYDYDEMQPRFEKFNEYEDLYLSYLSNRTNPWKSAVFDPESFEKVERMVSHLFATKPRGRFLPREGSDTKGVRIADEVFKYQWDKNGQQMHRKLMRIGRNAGIFGTGFGILHWRYERRQVTTIKDGKETKQWRVIWDDPYFQDLYIYDCFPDTTAISVEDMQHFTHNEYVTIDQLEATNFKVQGQKRYKNLDLLKEAVEKKGKRGKPATVDSYRTRVESIYGGDTTSMEGRILVRRYYDREKWCTIVPDYKLIIENRKNPYWHADLPVHILTDHDYTNQLLGIGEIEPIERLQKGLNSVLNQRLDNVRLILDPAVMVDADSKYAVEWKWSPGYKWRVEKGEEKPEPFVIPDTTGNTFMQTTSYFKDAMSRALGHQDFTTRNEGGEDKTAAEVRASGAEQNVRMRAKEYNVDAFIQRLATQWMQLNQQFLDKARLIRIVGKDAIEVFMKNSGMNEDAVVQTPSGNSILTQVPRTAMFKGDEVDKFKISDDGAFGLLVVEPEDLQGEMDFIVEIGSTTPIDTAQEQANTQSAIKMLMELEPKLQAEGKKIDYTALVQKGLSDLNIKNIDEIITSAPDQSQQTDAMGNPIQQPAHGVETGLGGGEAFNQALQQNTRPQPAPMPMMNQVAQAPMPMQGGQMMQ